MAGLSRGERERQPPAFMFCAEWQDWERTWRPDWKDPHPAAHALPCISPPTSLPPRPLWLIMEMRKDHPEDNTSFNPETELNNTDATCAFKCLFEGACWILSGIQLSKVFFFLNI